jgi:energy-coupling factor transporter ATP-binding protein EcfA2
MAANEPVINRGKRATIAGRTGSGKSTLGKWLLQRSPGTWIILNPKHTAAYNTLPNSVVLKGMDVNKLDKLLREYKFINVWPNEFECNEDAMDDFIAYLTRTYSNIGICIDELYSLHSNGRAGPGLLGLLTRGRELKQSYIGMTQRPAFISKFCFSEADYVAGMTLLSDDDRKMMTKNTGRAEFAEPMAPHDWLWFDAANAQMRFFGPVPLN